MTDAPYEGPTHLRPMPDSVVAIFCDRAIALAGTSYSLRLEIKGFRETRTPWDAKRLANGLEHCSDPATQDALDLARDLRGEADLWMEEGRLASASEPGSG